MTENCYQKADGESLLHGANTDIIKHRELSDEADIDKVETRSPNLPQTCSLL